MSTFVRMLSLLAMMLLARPGLAAATVAPAATPTVIGEKTTEPTAPTTPAASYAEREASAKNLEQFKGGGSTIVITTTTAIIVLLVVLVLILI